MEGNLKNQILLHKQLTDIFFPIWILRGRVNTEVSGWHSVKGSCLQHQQWDKINNVMNHLPSDIIPGRVHVYQFSFCLSLCCVKWNSHAWVIPLDHLSLTFKAPCLYRQTIEIPYLSHCLPRRSTPRHKRTLFLVVSRVVPVPVQLRLSLPGWLLYNHTRRCLFCSAGLTHTDTQT